MCACASSAADDGQGKTHLLGAAANTFDGLFLTAGDSTETDSLATSGVSWPATVAAAGMRSPTGTALQRLFGWWAKVSGAARSRLTWPSSRPTSRGARARCYLSVKPRGTRVMGTGHLERLRRARDLLAVKGYDTEQTRLTCYSGARFDPELADRAAGDPLIQLVGLEELYA